MNSCIILDTAHHRVTSYGNGTAYAAERKADGLSFIAQGDDATAFHEAIFEQDIFTFDVAISILYSEAFQS